MTKHYCGHGECYGHGDFAVCGEPYCGEIYQCSNCKLKDYEMTKKHRQTTNIEVLVELMNYSSQGALMQGYIMNAIENYSDKLLESQKPSDWPDEGLSWESWVACAQECKKALSRHFNRNSKVIEHE